MTNEVIKQLVACYMLKHKTYSITEDVTKPIYFKTNKSPTLRKIELKEVPFDKSLNEQYYESVSVPTKNGVKHYILLFYNHDLSLIKTKWLGEAFEQRIFALLEQDFLD